MSVLLSNPQHEFGHLRPAVEAERLLAGQAAHYVNTQAPQSAANELRLVPVIMIAQDRECRNPPTQPAQERNNPAPVIIAVDKIAGERHQVRLPGPAFVHDLLIELAIRAAGKVEIAQVQDG